MSGVALLSNAASRRNRRDPSLHKALAERIGAAERCFTPASTADLARTARALRELDPGVLCVNGGDGTLHTLLTALAPLYGDAPLPAIQLLRGGTMNTIAHGIGLFGTPLQLLDGVLTRGGAPLTTVDRSTVRVDGAQIGFLFGNGIVARFLEAYYAGGDPSPATAVALLAKGIASAALGTTFFRELSRPWEGEVEADGEAWGRGPWLSVAAGTVDDIGISFRPFYLAPSSPGRMHAIGLGQSGAALVRELHRMYRARPLRHPATKDQVVERLVLRSDTPIDYMVDGDFHRGGTELLVEIGPTVRFVRRAP